MYPVFEPYIFQVFIKLVGNVNHLIFAVSKFGNFLKKDLLGQVNLRCFSIYCSLKFFSIIFRATLKRKNVLPMLSISFNLIVVSFKTWLSLR